MNSDLQLLANVTLLRNGSEDGTTSNDLIQLGDKQEKRKFWKKNVFGKNEDTYIYVGDGCWGRNV